MKMIKNFNFGKGITATIYCRSRNTRNGFAHDCTIPVLGIKATVHYLNRTWESFPFESVLHSIFDKFVRMNYGAKTREMEYKRLAERLTAWNNKGKILYVSEPNEIFGKAA